MSHSIRPPEMSPRSSHHPIDSIALSIKVFIVTRPLQQSQMTNTSGERMLPYVLPSHNPRISIPQESERKGKKRKKKERFWKGQGAEKRRMEMGLGFWKGEGDVGVGEVEDC